MESVISTEEKTPDLAILVNNCLMWVSDGLFVLNPASIFSNPGLNSAGICGLFITGALSRADSPSVS